MKESDQELLRKLWDEGSCIVGIAATIGLSYTQARKAVKKLNLPQRRNPRAMLTAEQDAMIADLLGQGLTISEAAKRLAMPYKTVRSYVRRTQRKDRSSAERAPKPISANRDEAYVRAVLDQGGFIRAELAPGGRVLINWRGERLAA